MSHKRPLLVKENFKSQFDKIQTLHSPNGYFLNKQIKTLSILTNDSDNNHSSKQQLSKHNKIILSIRRENYDIN